MGIATNLQSIHDDVRKTFDASAPDEEHFPSTIDPRICHVRVILDFFGDLAGRRVLLDSGQELVKRLGWDQVLEAKMIPMLRRVMADGERNEPSKPPHILIHQDRLRASHELAHAENTIEVATHHLPDLVGVEPQPLVPEETEELADEHEVAVGVVLHDLNQAAAVADHMVLLDQGRVRASGAPDDVLTDEHLTQTYGIQIHVAADPVTGQLTARPIGRHSRRAPVA